MSTSYVSKRTKIPHSKNCYSTGQTLPTAYSPNKGMCEKQFQGRLSNMFQLQRGLFKTQSCLKRERKLKLKKPNNKSQNKQPKVLLCSRANETHSEAAELGCERVKGDKTGRFQSFQSVPKSFRGAGKKIWCQSSTISTPGGSLRGLAAG